MRDSKIAMNLYILSGFDKILQRNKKKNLRSN